MVAKQMRTRTTSLSKILLLYLALSAAIACMPIFTGEASPATSSSASPTPTNPSPTAGNSASPTASKSPQEPAGNQSQLTYLPAVFALIGVAVGGIITFCGQAFFYFRGRASQRTSLKVALSGEVASLCEMLISHDYVSQAVAALRAGGRGNRPIFSIHGSLVRIYDHNVENIGLLAPNTVPLVVKVYDSAEILVELSRHFQPDSTSGISQFHMPLRNWLNTASQFFKAAKEFLSSAGTAAEHAKLFQQIDGAVKDIDSVLQSSPATST